METAFIGSLSVPSPTKRRSDEAAGNLKKSGYDSIEKHSP